MIPILYVVGAVAFFFGLMAYDTRTGLRGGDPVLWTIQAAIGAILWPITLPLYLLIYGWPRR